MRQQINLYQEVLIDRPEPLQARQAWFIILIASVCLALVAGYSYRQTINTTAELNDLRQQIQGDSQRLSNLETQYPEIRKNVLLEGKIAHLKQEIKGQRQALNYFSDQDVESNADILATLEGLAKTPYAGVWLSRIRLLERGEEALLAGSATSADQIPDYLALLGSEHVFGGRVFSRLKLNRLENKAEQINFMLKSSQEEGQ